MRTCLRFNPMSGYGPASYYPLANIATFTFYVVKL